MSILMRRIYLCSIGLIAGACVWPILEFVLTNQEKLSSYVILSIVSGIISGMFIGSFFGSINGIVLNNKFRIMTGMFNGMISGIIAGVLGFLLSQVLFFVIGEFLLQNMRSFKSIGLPVSRAIGWAVMGLFIGAGEGARSRSFTKIKIGIAGGLLGGLVGGFVLEYLIYFWPNIILARFAGLLIFGLMLGFFYGLVESKMSFGKLHLLNGKYKGKEFIINQRTLRIGKKRSNDIVLSDYNKINDSHAELRILKNELYIKPKSLKNNVKVNDKQINSHRLIRDDVIQIGNAKLMYRY